MKTIDNVKAAFAGESQANRKYLAFAKKAEKEGFPQTAKLFRAAAYAETIHAHNHLDVMDGVKSTIDNLKEAVQGESYEFSTMYPEFIEQAKADGNDKALRSFTIANEVEKIHEKLYSNALESITKGSDIPHKDVYVCEICGNTIEGEAHDDCTICGATPEKFTLVE